jgi:hypothetical protein
MVARASAPLLVAAAALAESASLDTAAGYVLLAAVPVAAVTALASFGRLVDLTGRDPGVVRARVEAGLGALGTIVLVAACALRSDALAVASQSSLTGTLVLTAAILLAVASLATALPVPRRGGVRGDVATAASIAE